MDQNIPRSVYALGLNKEYALNSLRSTVSLSGGGEVSLSPQESDLLCSLALEKGAVILRGDMCRRLGVRDDNLKVIRCHIYKKMGIVGQSGPIRTHWGGYAAVVPDATHKTRVTFGDITYFPDAWMVVSGTGPSRQEATLSQELNVLMRLLADNLGDRISKQRLYREVLSLSQNSAPIPKIVDVLICKLRNVLDGVSLNGGLHLATTFGVGYGLYPDKVSVSDHFVDEGERDRYTGKLLGTLETMRRRQLVATAG
jgi:DNA-binding response OmpR family regulator